MRPVAVLCKNKETACNFIKEAFKIKQVDNARRRLISETDIEYIPINSFEEASIMIFSSYIVAPDYYSLEDYVKTRIRVEV